MAEDAIAFGDQEQHRDPFGDAAAALCAFATHEPPRMLSARAYARLRETRSSAAAACAASLTLMRVSASARYASSTSSLASGASGGGPTMTTISPFGGCASK